MTRSKIFKGGFQLGATQAVSQSCSFLRNVIIARLITPADFGIAATFSITTLLLEALGSLSPDKLLIQAKDGDETKLQGTAQLVMVLRGALAGGLILLCAAPAARLFGVPQATWAFRCLGLVPFFRSLVNLDMYRVQRQMKFGPAVKVEMTTSLLMTLAAWPLAIYFRSYAVMLWIAVAQAASSTALSHLVSERGYFWSWNKEMAVRILSFGWPLVINSLLLFGVFQGDRFIIGSANKVFHHDYYTLAELGVYSVAFSLTLLPAQAFSNLSVSLVLPILSRLQAMPAEFARRYSTCCEGMTLFAGLFALPLIVAGGWIVTTIYGKRYFEAGSLVGWLAGMQALRIIRTAATIAALSKGDTKNAMISNIVRSLAFVAALMVASVGASVALIAAAGFCGEVIALLVCVLRLQRCHSVAAWICLKPAILTALFLAACATCAALSASANCLVKGLLVCLLAGAAIWGFSSVFPSVWSLALSVWANRFRNGHPKPLVVESSLRN